MRDGRGRTAQDAGRARPLDGRRLMAGADGRLSPPGVKIAAFVGIFDFLLWRDLALEAEQLGFESFWVPEHLVLPLGMSGRPGVATDRGDSPDDHPFVPPHLPLADPLVALADV